MTANRRRSPFNRLRSLFGGVLSLWVRRRENDHPEAVYEQAIEARRTQYGELKQAVAGILYMRNRLEGEIRERRAELHRLTADVTRAVARGDDPAALSLIAHKQTQMEELERAERELEGIHEETETAKQNLLRFREEIRALEQEKVRTLATLANAHARRRIQLAFEGLSVDHEMRALEGVRENVSRLVAENRLDREMGGEGGDAHVRAYRAEARTEAARAELAELKRKLSGRRLPEVVDVPVRAGRTPQPAAAAAAS